jgi:hypothetical protein
VDEGRTGATPIGTVPPAPEELLVNQKTRQLALLLLLSSSLLTQRALGEKVVFRDGKSTEVTKPPCISGDKVLLEIEGLPTAIAYDRNLIDEARTFHANPQTPVLRLFGPCTASGPVAVGVTDSRQAPAPQTPLRAYTAPPSSGGSNHESSGGRCAAITKKGTRCSRRAQPGRAYCYQH